MHGASQEENEQERWKQSDSGGRRAVGLAEWVGRTQADNKQKSRGKSFAKKSIHAVCEHACARHNAPQPAWQHASAVRRAHDHALGATCARALGIGILKNSKFASKKKLKKLPSLAVFFLGLLLSKKNGRFLFRCKIKGEVFSSGGFKKVRGFDGFLLL